MAFVHRPAWGRTFGFALLLAGCRSEAPPTLPAPAELAAPAAARSTVVPAPSGSAREPPGDLGEPRRATGYRDGTPIDLWVVRLDGQWVETNTARAFDAMREAANRDGVELRITSGFRTQTEQEKLYRCYRRGRCPLAARPGHSKHQSGLALDLDVRTSLKAGTWLARHARQFGFQRKLQPEPWHWQRDEP